MIKFIEKSVSKCYSAQIGIRGHDYTILIIHNETTGDVEMPCLPGMSANDYTLAHKEVIEEFKKQKGIIAKQS